MTQRNSRVSLRPCCSIAVIGRASVGAMAQTAPQTPAAQAKAVGQIKSISGDTLTLTTDDGKSVSVSLPMRCGWCESRRARRI